MRLPRVTCQLNAATYFMWHMAADAQETTSLQRDSQVPQCQRWLLLQRLEVDMAIFQQGGKDVSMMVVSDLPS